MRSVPQQLGLRLSLLGDLEHRVAEGVERLLALALGRLDHHRLVDDEREVDRRRMIAVIDHPLGDVERAGALSLLPLPGEDHLVHAAAVVRQAIRSAQALLDVVGVQHGRFADSAQAIGAEASDVCVRTQEDAEVAVKRTHTSDAVRRINECICRFGV